MSRAVSSLVLLALVASCGGAIVPTNKPDPEFGVYGEIDTGVSSGTLSGALAGNGAPARSVSLTSAPVEGSVNVVVGLGPFGLRPNLFAGIAEAGHSQRYIGLGIDALLQVVPHVVLMLGAGSVSDTIRGTPATIDSLNGHRFDVGAAYTIQRFALFARYLRTSVSTGSDASEVDATTNALLVGFTARFR